MNTSAADIKANIATLDKAINSPATPENFKDKLRTKKSELELALVDVEKIVVEEKKVDTEIKEVKASPASPAKKIAVKKVEQKKEVVVEKKKAKLSKADELIKQSKDLLAKKSPEVREFNKNRSNKEIKLDSRHTALKPGKHTSASGKTYYERRPGHTDISPRQHLAGGGVLEGSIEHAKVLINAELEKLKSDKSYYDSEAANNAQNNIFEYLKDACGWDWENDDAASEYFLKATHEEILKYVRDEVIPNISERSNVEDEDENEEEDEDESNGIDEPDYENDAFITDIVKGGYDLSYSGKHIAHFKDFDDALDELKKRMEKDSYWCSIWSVNERGSAMLIDANGNEIKGYSKGGRLKSAINRDRKYQSNEPWERNYQRAGNPKHPHYKKMAGGGTISDSYDSNDTAEDVWNKWTESQREHFISDHAGKSGMTFKQMTSFDGYLTWEFNNLPMNIQTALINHVNEGRYAGGGKIPSYFGSGQNISVFGYETRNFDISSKSVDEVTRAREYISANSKGKLFTDHSATLRNLAEALDNIFGIEKTIVNLKSIDQEVYKSMSAAIGLCAIYNSKLNFILNLDFLGNDLYEMSKYMPQSELVVEDSFEDGGQVPADFEQAAIEMDDWMDATKWREKGYSIYDVSEMDEIPFDITDQLDQYKNGGNKLYAYLPDENTTYVSAEGYWDDPAGADLPEVGAFADGGNLNGDAITDKDIVEGAKFKTASGIVWIIDEVDTVKNTVHTSMEHGAKGNYRDPIATVVDTLNEEKAVRIDYANGGRLYYIPYNTQVIGYKYHVKGSGIDAIIKIAGFERRDGESFGFYQFDSDRNDDIGSLYIKNTAISKLSKGEPVKAVLKDGQIVTVTKQERIEGFASGGRLKSALMRDRKYTSTEEWEKNYVRKNQKHLYKTLKAGGPVGYDIHESAVVPYLIGERAVWGVLEDDKRFADLNPEQSDKIVKEITPQLILKSEEKYRMDSKFRKKLNDDDLDPRYELELEMESWSRELLKDYQPPVKPPVKAPTNILFRKGDRVTINSTKLAAFGQQNKKTSSSTIKKLYVDLLNNINNTGVVQSASQTSAMVKFGKKKTLNIPKTLLNKLS